MQRLETAILSHSDVNKIPFSFIKASTFRKQSSHSTIRPVIKNKPVKKPKISLDEAGFQVQDYISLIEDPLWKQVCIEFIKMAGPNSILRIWNSNLGSLSLHSKTIELFCQTEEAAQFLQQYDFVILGTLRQYFSALKELHVSFNTN